MQISTNENGNSGELTGLYCNCTDVKNMVFE